MQDVVVVFNSGSSSLKLTIYAFSGKVDPQVLLHGEIEEFPDHSQFTAKDAEGKLLAQEKWPETGLHIYSHLFQWFEQYSGQGRVLAVGHRIVHGGAEFLQPVKITLDTLKQLDKLTPFDPLHQAATLAPAKAIFEKRPDILQIACFDTTFHQTIPEMARLLPLPRRYADHAYAVTGFMVFHTVILQAAWQKLILHSRKGVLLLRIWEAAPACVHCSMVKVWKQPWGFPLLMG